MTSFFENPRLSSATTTAAAAAVAVAVLLLLQQMPLQLLLPVPIVILLLPFSLLLVPLLQQLFLQQLNFFYAGLGAGGTGLM